ncbi:MAG TPA: cytochrome d ubiquinol oxidase subunit II, partial [Anaerolineaceae bacterium]|nr:cytochrome d ubiquinol oxidase subunit II [Anaerolineaceae bacterium]
MDLNTLWFILIAILYIGYFILEGFDFGVGILLPWLGKNDIQRRVIINTIGPHWDGNEVWLITAGGATFAAFPIWYATLFSGFYMPLFLMLLALIVRGVAFEFRSKDDNPRWRSLWDWAIFGGSLLPSILWGVAFANIVRGVPIDSGLNYVGGFWNLLNPYALLGGLVTLSGFVLQGSVFLALKTSGEISENARRTAMRFWLPTLVILVAFTVASYFATDILSKLGVNPGPIPI